jgi:DNA-binding MarR family transcriptional regulator
MGIRLAELGLHQGQDELLMALDMGDPLSVSALSEKLVVRPSTVSKMLDPLCAKGLVDRVPTARDARLTLVRLTEKGDSAKTQVQRLWHVIEIELAGKMPPAGKDSMLGALGTIDGIIGSRLMRLR